MICKQRIINENLCNHQSEQSTSPPNLPQTNISRDHTSAGQPCFHQPTHSSDPNVLPFRSGGSFHLRLVRCGRRCQWGRRADVQAQQQGLWGGLVQGGSKGEWPGPSPPQEAASCFISVISGGFIPSRCLLTDLSRWPVLHHQGRCRPQTNHNRVQRGAFWEIPLRGRRSEDRGNDQCQRLEDVPVKNWDTSVYENLDGLFV